ncbi:MAG: hypothetical protein Q8N26_37380, partial [Myxococcales bacterium]|nr:hypothetical protein [Myxococcales bacterium]
GSAAGGAAAGGAAAGGAAAGGSAAGGAAAGGSAAGGSAGGGSAAGGSAAGGSAAGGSAGGGSASMVCPGTTTPCAGCCVGPLCVTVANQNNSACGSDAAACAPCANGTCNAGQCSVVAMCNPTSCPNGCCQGNLCVPFGGQNASQCGSSGLSCSACQVNNSCVMGACTPTTACDFFSCPGCCANGVCQQPSAQTATACGVNGATCTGCVNGATCTAGVCTGGTVCNATNCTGCCNGTMCVTPNATTAMACGHSGNVCSACGPGQTCSAGVCVPQQNPACIVFTPTDVDFGTVQTGCRSAQTSFTIRNVCGFPITLSALGVSGAGFANTSPTPLPATMGAGSSLSFSVTFAPTVNGRVNGILVAGANHSNGTFAYQTSVWGTGASAPLNQDRFTIPTKTDVVLIVDNSCSMFDKQMALGGSANAFLAYAFSANVDFNLGVTTTDMSNQNESGRFQGMPAVRVLRSTTPNLLQTFNQRVNAGTNGSGLEEMFRPAVAALSPALLTTTNTGFLRADAALSVLAFTDAAEQSAGATSDFVRQLLAVKGLARRNQFSFSFVGPTLPAASRPSNCQYDGNAPDARQIEMIASTGGISSEICNVGNTLAWRTEATRVGQAIFGGRATWFLNGRPAPAAASSLTVTLNGVAVPEFSPAGPRNWTYDAARNAVVFEARTLPAPGQTVGVDYPVACMP